MSLPSPDCPRLSLSVPSAELDNRQESWLEMIAHDLQQPVNAIVLRTDLLLRRALGDKDRADVLRIREATMQMSQQVKDFLDAAQLETRRLVLRRERLELGRLLQATLNRLADRAARVALRAADADELWVHGDPGRIEQVLVNLLSNAAKCGDPDAPIGIALSRSADNAQVVVETRGRGIRVEELAHLFQGIRSPREAKDATIPGSGLGLYIARELVEAHGGRMWAESGSAGGVRFCFTLSLC